MFDRPLSMTDRDGVLLLEGSIDEYALADLREHLADLLGGLAVPGGRLAIDLSAVDFLPSAAIGVLVQAMKSAREVGALVVLVATDGSPAQQVLSITGIRHVPSLSSLPDHSSVSPHREDEGGTGPLTA